MKPLCPAQGRVNPRFFRWELLAHTGPGAVPEPAAGPHGAHRDGDPGATVFSGGADGDARGEKFGGPDPEVSVSSRP